MTPKLNLRGYNSQKFPAISKVCNFCDKLLKSPSNSISQGLIVKFFGNNKGTVLHGP